MEFVQSLEKSLSQLYKNVPHLPAGGRKWLGDNVWWLVIIAVVISVFGVFALLGALSAAFGLSAYVASSPYAAYASGSWGMVWLVSLIALAGLVITTVLMLMAINPLKTKAKLGWTLLFIILLIELVFGIVGDIVAIDIFGIILSLLWAAVWGYFLFEIRGEFGRAAKPVAEKPAKIAKK